MELTAGKIKGSLFLLTHLMQSATAGVPRMFNVSLTTMVVQVAWMHRCSLTLPSFFWLQEQMWGHGRRISSARCGRSGFNHIHKQHITAPETRNSHPKHVHLLVPRSLKDCAWNSAGQALGNRLYIDTAQHLQLEQQQPFDGHGSTWQLLAAQLVCPVVQNGSSSGGRNAGTNMSFWSQGPGAVLMLKSHFPGV